MVDTLAYSVLVGISVLELLFMVGSVYYAYRISRLLGSFLGWTLIILGFALFTVRNASTLLLLPYFSGPEIDTLLTSIGSGTLVITSVINLAAPLILFLGTYFLARTFERKMKSDAAR